MRCISHTRLNRAAICGRPRETRGRQTGRTAAATWHFTMGKRKSWAGHCDNGHPDLPVRSASRPGCQTGRPWRPRSAPLKLEIGGRSGLSGLAGAVVRPLSPRIERSHSAIHSAAKCTSTRDRLPTYVGLGRGVRALPCSAKVRLLPPAEPASGLDRTRRFS